VTGGPGGGGAAPGARELSLAVVGIDYPNPDRSNRRFELALMRPGDPVELRREPKNPADPRAVGVFSERGIRVGYLSAERCGWVGARIARGEPLSAVFQELQGRIAVVRVRFGGGEPTLPEPGPHERDDVQPFDDGW
jgi:hypothetical protein